MTILTELLILFSICLAGEWIALLLPFSFPASVISMLILLLLFLVKWLRAEQIKNISGFLLQNMAFFFIPAGVGIMEQYSFLKGKILILLLISFITMVLTFLASVYTVQIFVKLIANRKGANKK